MEREEEDASDRILGYTTIRLPAADDIRRDKDYISVRRAMGRPEGRFDRQGNAHVGCCRDRE